MNTFRQVGPVVLTLVFLGSAQDASAQRGGRGVAPNGPETIEAAADRIFAAYNSTHTPGCAVGVDRNGATILARGYGMADLEAGMPITASTIFESGSVAKQFTATATLLLMKDGKINMDDPVRKFVPELPEYPRPVLMRHLLSHTSGLREWSNLVALAGWPRGTRVHTQQDLLDAVFAQKSLNYPVGDFYSYTNSGFALLATIVERVSGMPFAKFTEQRIFKPLGMTHTSWRDDFRRLVPDRAQAYSGRGKAVMLDMPFEDVVGPGGLLTTVGDWLKWNQALTDKTLGRDVVDSLTTQAVLTSGRTISYARGVIVQKYRGIPEIQHSGSTGGYSTYLARYPDKQLSIAVMCNVAGANATLFTHSLVDALVPGLAPATPPDTVAADPAAVAKFAGIYRSTRTHEPLVVSDASRGGGGRGAAVRALAGGGWLLGNNRATFDVGADGTPRGAKVVGADNDTTAYVFAARTPWTPTTAHFDAFVGRYRSDEVPATWTVRIENGVLIASPRAAMRVTLTPVYPDAFTATDGLGVVWFTRNASGAVVQMHSGAARVWDFAFDRVK
jgi:CubicO group peptidase (beta-lactamase class C family)